MRRARSRWLGRMLLFAGVGAASLWVVAAMRGRREFRRTHPPHSVSAISASPDGRLLFGVGSRVHDEPDFDRARALLDTLYRWDMETRRLARFALPGPVASFARFTPRGDRVFTGAEIWDLPETGPAKLRAKVCDSLQMAGVTEDGSLFLIREVDAIRWVDRDGVERRRLSIPHHDPQSFAFDDRGRFAFVVEAPGDTRQVALFRGGPRDSLEWIALPPARRHDRVWHLSFRNEDLRVATSDENGRSSLLCRWLTDDPATAQWRPGDFTASILQAWASAPNGAWTATATGVPSPDSSGQPLVEVRNHLGNPWARPLEGETGWDDVPFSAFFHYREPFS
jgi:hypothetical protein